MTWDPPLELLARDPFPLYDAARGAAPVWWRRSAELEGWAVFDYQTVSWALNDPRLSAAAALPAEQGSMSSLVRRWLQFQDPPAHERLRRPLQAAVGRAWAEGLRDRAAHLARDLVEALDPAGFDLMADLALPLPVAVIADLLGMPAADRPRVRRWAACLVDFLGVADPGPEAAERLEQAAAEMADYFGHLWDRAPAAALAALAAWQDPPLDRADVVANCAQLLFAGHETTLHLIGNSVLALLEHPQPFREEGLEELLRHSGPVMLTNRVALEPVALGAGHANPGQFVFLMLAAANRDPARFPDPHRLDLERADRRHLAFGAGRHLCLGAGLARAETAAALSALLARFPKLEALEEPAWEPRDYFRGFASLRLRA